MHTINMEFAPQLDTPVGQVGSTGGSVDKQESLDFGAVQ